MLEEGQHQDSTRRVREIESAAPHPLYLGFRWIENAVSEYQQGRCRLMRLRERAVIFPERHFAAALTHLYAGAFSLDEIADMVSTSSAALAFLRTQADFMMLVDAAKVSFARHFRENLSINEYTPAKYASIASEYGVFEELARNLIRVPLFRRMQQLADSISHKVRHELPIEMHHLRDFKKLFSFFRFEERSLQGLKRPSFEYLTTVAKEIVWHRLGADYEAFDPLLSTEFRIHDVKVELRNRFACLEFH